MGVGHTLRRGRMYQNVHCNGGPWHDRRVAVENGRDHFHIIEPVADVVAREMTKEHDADEGLQVVHTREGMYSQVRGVPGEFEWDGWRSHD
ncbi:hypothetical protein SEA_SCHIMMELS22_44 [Microbacterium phage Schimmels22]|nr:hypothetical protein SEA_SCHIMMELS22_44 [Microbacterium phage Schimmels22]